MKKLILSLLLMLALLFAPVSYAQSVPKMSIDSLYNSVALLYTQDSSGSMRMTCSVTAFAVAPTKPGAKVEKETIYRFVSAAHCVEGGNEKQQKLQKFYISADTKGTKAYFPATLIQTGDKTLGDDFSLFEVKTTDVFDITPIGDSTKLVMGDSVIDVSGALGLGKQFFQGYVSEVHLDRPPVDAGIVQWTDVMLIQIGGGPGSSGSAIVSVSQGAIVGFLVGSDGHGDVGKLCVPAAKFKDFVAAVDAGTYKKSKKSDDDSVSGAE